MFDQPGTVEFDNHLMHGRRSHLEISLHVSLAWREQLTFEQAWSQVLILLFSERFISIVNHSQPYSVFWHAAHDIFECTPLKSLDQMPCCAGIHRQANENWNFAPAPCLAHAWLSGA